MTEQDNDSEVQKYLELSEKLTFLTGKSQSEIFSEWRVIFHERDQLLDSIRNISDNKQIEQILAEHEKDWDFSIYWTMQVFKTIAKLQKAKTEVQRAEIRIEELTFARKLRDADNSLSGIGGELGYPDRIVRREIAKPYPMEENISILGELEVSSIRQTIRGIKKLSIEYRLRRIARKARRFLFRAFWSLLIIAIGVNAFVSAMPLWYLRIALTVAAWVFQEYVFQPWFDKKLLEKHRTDLQTLVRELYFAKFKADINIMTLTPYHSISQE